jgi:putative sugar O-methyltransferase
MQKCYFGPKIKERYRHLFLGDVVHRHELWKQETDNKYSIADLVSPDIGNPYGFFVDGVFLKAGSDYQHCYAARIGSILQPSTQQTVVELGGGFGGMAYYIIRDNPHTTYIDLDLPENMSLATYYLLKAFPTLPALLYVEAELTTETLKNYRIVLMPSFEIQKLETKSVSVSFNSYSLAEMSPSAIQEYIDNIARITHGYFMHINHTRNAVVTADNFGVEKHGFRLLERRIAGWTLGLNPNADEFQFLYQA